MRLLALLMLLALLPACGLSAGSQAAGGTQTVATAASGEVPVLHGRLTIFAASSLTESFDDMKANLERASSDLTVQINYAGSSALRVQLSQRARADVFASADQPNMQGAQQDGTVASVPQVFARNRLVVVVPSGNPGHVTRLQDLARPGLKLVLAQEQVPAGAYARQALDRMSADPSFGSGFKSQALANLVSSETNVRAALSKVELGEADATVVYVTDITAAALPSVRTIDIPDQFNVVASYPLAVVKDAPDAANAQAFIDYVLSDAGQAILARHGFTPVNGTANKP